MFFGTYSACDIERNIAIEMAAASGRSLTCSIILAKSRG